MPRKRSAGLPSRKQILDFIASSDQPAGKREIARAFGLSGQDKIDLKRLLKDMADEGLIDSSPGRAFHQAGGVPKVTVLRVADGRRRRQCLGGAGAMACRNAAAEAAADRARQAQRARHRRPGARADRGARGRASSPIR